jgi:hypothetical protein
MSLEAFAISFEKLVAIVERVDIQKHIDATVFIAGNSALADAKAESDAVGSPNTHTETLALTTTAVVQGVGSSSSSIAESVAASQPDDLWNL